MHGLLQLFGRLLGRQKLSILIYHQVVADTDPMRPSEPTAKVFDWQMWLIAKFFTPMSLTEALVALEKQQLPANAICVTFDDGYLNNLTVAQPILAKYQVPATVYVATGYSSGGNMFNDRILDFIGDQSRSSFNLTVLDLGKQQVSDYPSRIKLSYQVIGKIKYLDFRQRQQVIDRLYQDNQASEYPNRMMTPEQIKTLANLGIDIGAHTVDHPILKTLSDEEQLAQLVDSKQTLENIIGQSVENFAYPNGKLHDDYSEQTVALVKKAGFNSAVATHYGISTNTSDFFQLKRFTPWDKGAVKFHVRLLINQIKGSS